MVITTSDKGARLKSIGSEYIGAPAGMLTDGWPSNVSGLSLSGLIAPGPADKATWAEEITSGSTPNSFVNRTRISWPPMETWKTWRSVLSANAGGGAVLGGALVGSN